MNRKLFHLTLIALLAAASHQAQATFMFSNVSYTSNTVTFTIDGDMTGYAAPGGGFDDQFSLIYGGDIFVGDPTFESNTWSDVVFDGLTFAHSGNTGTASGNDYSWSRYSTGLATATATNRTITLTMTEPDLNVSALNPLISFAWGNGQPGLHTVLESVTVNGAVPEPGTVALLGAGLLGLGARRRRAKTA